MGQGGELALPGERSVKGPVVITMQLAEIWNELKRRLEERGTDTQEVIDFRMKRAAAEIGHWAEYDYVVINRDLDRAFNDVRAILAAERLKRERQTGLSAFVRGLQSDL